MKEMTLCSVLILMLSGLSGPSVSAGVDTAARIELGNDQVRLSLSGRGEILGIEDLVTHTKMLVPDHSGKAWHIGIGEKGNLTNLDYTSPQIRRTGTSVGFAWKKNGCPTVDATISFDAKTQQFRFSAIVRNETKEILSGLAYPETLAFADAKENYLVVCSDNEFNTSLKPLNELKPFTVMYPGYMFMQMIALKIGDSSMLLYTDDTKAQVKWLSFKHEKKAVRMDLTQRIRLKPGRTWKAPYGVVVKVIPHGTYQEMADAYAQWGRRQWWAKEKLTDKMAKTPLLKRYFEAGLVRMTMGPPVCSYDCFRQTEDTRWHYIEKNKYSKYEPYYDSVVASIPVYEKAYGVAPGYWYPNWSGHWFDSQYPDYFPVLKCMGDFDKYHQAMIDNRWPIMYHVNIAHWPQTTPSAQISKYLAITDKGTNYRNIWCSFPKLNHVLTSPSVSLPVEMKTVNRLKDNEGVHGIYLDVIGHAFATDDNPNCKYFGEPNCYQLEKMEAFKTIRNAIKGPLMTEGRNEIELLYMDMGTGACGSADVDEIPLWQMVYGDCAALTDFGSGGNKRTRYHTWMLGGVQNMTWDWPEPAGKCLDIYLVSSQQKVISHVVGQRMQRFDRLGECRISQWPSGVVVWNKAKSGKPVEIERATTLGKLAVGGLDANGIAILTTGRDFCADSVKSINLNGKILFSNQSSVPVSITRAGPRWVIHNENKQPAKVSFTLAADWADLTPLSGKIITAGQSMVLHPAKKDNRIVFEAVVPAEDCLVLDEMKK